jgi:predicted RND superfamily exporter protein
LVKGITLSFLSVMVFLPALTLVLLKALDKTRHRAFLPKLKGVGGKLLKARIPCLIFVLILIVPCVLASNHNAYIYGNGKSAPTGRGGKSAAQIAERFGESNPVVLLVPRGDTAREKALCDELAKIEHVNAVVSYASMVGTAIPDGYLPAEITAQFYSEHWARIILYTDTESEGDEAFAAVRAIQKTAGEYYDEVYSLGESANLYDMKNVVESDAPTVNLIAILAILLVLFISFRSFSLPLLLLFTIEAAVYLNLAVPYFQGSPLCYIGYLVISTVQLGATVDYAILLTDNYRLNRERLDKRAALSEALDEHLISILISGAILACAGFCLMLTSSNPIVSELGLLLGRGTLLSMAMVAFVLPALLLLFDKIIGKTTLNFLRKGDKK